MHRSITSLLLLVAASFASPVSAAEPTPRKVEGNRPRPTQPRDDGRIVLVPDAAEFYGEAIRINPDNHCIAWWEKQADYVAWEVESPRGGEYEVWLEWAIADDLAGNGFRIRVGDATFTGTIGKTGGWTTLKREKAGTVKIPAGKARLEMRVEGPLKGELADVRAITLNPVGAAAPPAAPEVPPKAPANSLNGIRVHPAMQVELVAAEPLVRDPIAIAWSADLRLWVVEMGDYPLGTDGHGGRGGRVTFLDDVDGDGRYDKATVFLEGLGFPAGVLPWKRGVIVACAPEIFYAEDTDGDGRADLRRPILTGFPERNQQHRVNGLRFGLDGWVYCANGDGGVGGDTAIVSVASGARTPLGSRDFRFHPETGVIEPQSGPSQFGRSRDDWGNWFGGHNGQPIYHFALDEQHLARNPRLKPPDPRAYLASVAGPYFTRSRSIAVHGEKPASGPRATGLGGACGAMIYRDTLLGPAFAGNAFFCDPVTNLVHHHVLTRAGSTFSGNRAADEPDAEFFSSDDPWTRPVMVQAGPDGALYVVDMYRLYIEHPEWIAKDVLARADLRAGSDRGRIYRIYPSDRRPRSVRRLDTATPAQLVAALDSPSGWQRDMALQRLIELGDRTVVSDLERLATSGSRPETRVQALAAAAALAAATDELVAACLRDPHPGVRQFAVTLAAARLAEADELVADLLPLARDPDGLVRVQVAAALGESSDPRCGRVIADMILADRNDRYLVATALSSATRRPAEVVAGVLAADPPVAVPLLTQVLSACAVGDAASVAGLAAAELRSPRVAGDLDRQFAIATAILRADLAAETSSAVAAPVAAICDRAREVLGDAAMTEEQRLVAVGLLGWQEDYRSADVGMLAGSITPEESPAVASAAVERLVQLADPTVGELLAERCVMLGPTVKSQVVQALVSREAWALALIDRLAVEPRLATLLGPARQQQLRQHPSAKVRAAAERQLGGAGASDRGKVVAGYTAAAAGHGDPSRGREVFRSQCAACHRLEEFGNAVGPDLTAVKEKPAQALIEAILDPNRAVEDKYLAYNAVTEDGRSITGLVQSESGRSITLVAADGQPHSLLRDELDVFMTTGRSLMPEGFENAIPPDRLRDLIAYLRQ